LGVAELLAKSERWHTFVKPLLGPDRKLSARQLVDEDGQPTEALRNLLPNDLFAALARPDLYCEGMDGLAQVYRHLPETVRATIDLTAWRRSKVDEMAEQQGNIVQRYVRKARPSSSEKSPGDDDPLVDK